MGKMVGPGVVALGTDPRLRKRISISQVRALI